MAILLILYQYMLNLTHDTDVFGTMDPLHLEQYNNRLKHIRMFD